MKGKKKWRLSKTLSRRVEVRPIENDDVKYAWAGYKQGKFSELGFAPNLDPSMFKTEFERFVLNNAHAAWTILADTQRGFVPVGIAMGQWALAFMMIADIEWFSWASRRNVTEGTVALFDRLRREGLKVIGFAKEDHKRLYEVCCMHSIMHRIGTSYSLGERMTVFEVRTNV